MDGEQSTNNSSVENEAISALSLLNEHDQLKVMDYIKSLISYTQDKNNEFTESRQ